jgi:hypothetical protein
VGTHPDADRAGDGAGADAFAEAWGEEHGGRIRERRDLTGDALLLPHIL